MILISAYADVPITVRAMRNGALTVLEKTVGPDNIETQVTRLRLRDLRAAVGQPEAPDMETFR